MNTRESCNGCRALWKGCKRNCVLRDGLAWIDNPDSQSFVTIFLSKFYGRSEFLKLISAGPEECRPDILRSILYEACGRTMDPINGTMGLICSGKWSYCEAAVQAVLSGTPIPTVNGGNGLEAQVINHPPLTQNQRGFHPYQRVNDGFDKRIHPNGNANVHTFINSSRDKGKAPIDPQIMSITPSSLAYACQNLISPKTFESNLLDQQPSVGSSTSENVVKYDRVNSHVPKDLDLELKLGWD